MPKSYISNPCRTEHGLSCRSPYPEHSAGAGYLIGDYQPKSMDRRTTNEWPTVMIVDVRVPVVTGDRRTGGIDRAVKLPWGVPQ